MSAAAPFTRVPASLGTVRGVPLLRAPFINAPLPGNFTAETDGACERHIDATFTPHERSVEYGPLKGSGAAAR